MTVKEAKKIISRGLDSCEKSIDYFENGKAKGFLEGYEMVNKELYALADEMAEVLKRNHYFFKGHGAGKPPIDYCMDCSLINKYTAFKKGEK